MMNSKIATSLVAIYTHTLSNLREEKYSIRTDRTYMSFWRIGLVCFFNENNLCIRNQEMHHNFNKRMIYAGARLHPCSMKNKKYKV